MAAHWYQSNSEDVLALVDCYRVRHTQLAKESLGDCGGFCWQLDNMVHWFDSPCYSSFYEIVEENQSTFLSLGGNHRLTNPSQIPKTHKGEGSEYPKCEYNIACFAFFCGSAE